MSPADIEPNEGFASLVGAFVRVGPDLGKVVQVAKGEAEVEFFDAPVPGGTTRLWAPAHGLTPVVLERQMRIWWNDGGQWRIGRVLEPPDENTSAYLIALFEGRNAELTSDQFYVRWSRPLADPVRLLEARSTDARFIHRSRSTFVREVLRHRAAVEQLTGISSSGVRLHQHQVSAARRVLHDPVRRYLLADEVGLGKTIEAGMVMRQTLLDEPNSRALVLAPAPIVAQWDNELTQKFDLQGLRGGWADVESYDAAIHESRGAGVPISILVVDEAHRLADAVADPSLYEAVECLAAQVPSMLLLSATPVRTHEEPFLRLLHLLDPQTYRLDDLDAFRRRIELRDQIGDAVTLLSDDTPVFLLQEAMSTLRSFPEDHGLVLLLDRLSDAVAADEEEAARTYARQVRHYVSDAYRIHRRLIRTRRNARLHEDFPVRRRAHGNPFRLADPDRRRRGIVESLDRFRSRLSGEVGLPSAELLRLVAGRCSATTPAVGALRTALRDEGDADLLEWERPLVAALQDHPLGAELATWLEEALSNGNVDGRLDEMASWAWARANRCKVAALSSYTSVGKAALERMRERYGPARVAALLSGMTEGELHREYNRAVTDEICVLLVCDSIAEEGWNLQFVSEVLHLDLPWSANRLEQRLGRFDRFSLGRLRLAPVLSSVFVDPAPLDLLTDAWTRLLDEGFDVFCTSSATLQYALPDHEAAMVQQVIEKGFGALASGIPEERERLDGLRRSIEGQDVLDSVEDEEDERQFFEQLIEVDRQSRAIGDSTSNWVGKALNFTENYTNGIFRFGIGKRAPPLLTASQIRGMGLDIFRRRYAVRRKDTGREGAVPLRPGQPLVDAAFELCFMDGRGAAFAAVLETDHVPTGAPLPVFYFDVLVEPAISELTSDDSVGLQLLERQAAIYLPPRLESVWYVPGRGEPPDSFRDWLTRERTDGLGEDIERFVALTAGMNWPATCRRAEASATALVVSRAQHAECISRARQSVDEQEARLVAHAATRSRFFGESFDADAVTARFARLRTAVTEPRLVTDSCGVVFLVRAE